jgi:hypothetical protein
MNLLEQKSSKMRLTQKRRKATWNDAAALRIPPQRNLGARPEAGLRQPGGVVSFSGSVAIRPVTRGSVHMAIFLTFEVKGSEFGEDTPSAASPLGYREWRWQRTYL